MKMSYFLKNNFLKFIVYGTSAIIATEIGFFYFRWCTKRFAEIRASQTNQEIADVIWINESTQKCDVKNPQRSPKFFHDDKKCKNMFCCSRNIGKIVTLIDNAKYSIDLCMYIFTSIELSLAFQRAIKRGLQIRIIGDKEMVYSSGSQITSFTKTGVPVRCPIAKNMLMHHKFCILDGPVRSRAVSKVRKTTDNDLKGILFTGSLNWTHQGFNSNYENMIMTSNEKLIKKFEDEFQRLWLSLEELEY